MSCAVSNDGVRHAFHRESNTIQYERNRCMWSMATALVETLVRERYHQHDKGWKPLSLNQCSIITRWDRVRCVYHFGGMCILQNWLDGRFCLQWTTRTRNMIVRFAAMWRGTQFGNSIAKACMWLNEHDTHGQYARRESRNETESELHALQTTVKEIAVLYGAE